MASKEETVARKVFDLIADVRLNPYYIGFHLAHSPDPNIYDMLKEIIEAIETTTIEREDNIKAMILGNNITDSEDFARKAETLQSALLYQNLDELSDFFENYEFLYTCWTAGAFVEGMVDKLSDIAIEAIPIVFDRLLEHFDLVDDGTVSSIEDITMRVNA